MKSPQEKVIETPAYLRGRIEAKQKLIEALQEKVAALESANQSLLNETERHLREKHEGINIVQNNLRRVTEEKNQEIHAQFDYAMAQKNRAEKAERELAETNHLIAICRITLSIEKIGKII
jgi:hypothetical protein